nr:immunoglobulin heavy chain junction region [Macaca mulatta]
CGSGRRQLDFDYW